MSQIPNLDLETSTKGQSNQYNTRDYFITETYIHNLLRYHPVRYTYYQLAICTSGSIKAQVDGKILCYSKGTFAAFTPSTILNVIEASDDYRCTLIIFQKNFLIETLNNIYFLERFHLLNNNGTHYMEVEKHESRIIVDQITKIRNQMEDIEHPFRRDIIRSLIIILLYEVESIYLKNNPYGPIEIKHGKDRTISNFQDLMRKHFYEEHQVAFYAKELNISTDQLTKLLKERTGKTAKEHIDNKILSQAKVFLNSGKYNVSEVALLLYYKNVEEFSRFFKKKTGITPLRFAKGSEVEK